MIIHYILRFNAYSHLKLLSYKVPLLHIEDEFIMGTLIISLAQRRLVTDAGNENPFAVKRFITDNISSKKSSLGPIWEICLQN